MLHNLLSWIWYFQGKFVYFLLQKNALWHKLEGTQVENPSMKNISTTEIDTRFDFRPDS